MMEHYKDKNNYGILYQETGARALKQVPNMLAIPLVAVRLFKLHKKGKMPHECLNLLLSHIEENKEGYDKAEFSKVKLSQDLIPGVGWKDPPTSLLNLILEKVMFAEPIIRPTYPTE